MSCPEIILPPCTQREAVYKLQIHRNKEIPELLQIPLAVVLISSLTVCGRLACLQHTGLNIPSLVSQFVFQILIDSPVPILLTKPCSNTFFPSRIAHQTLDGDVPKLASKKSQVGKYIALRIRALSDVSSCSMLQACRAKRARLNISISLKPNPPICFGFVISSHATQHVFLLPSMLPHQKLRKRPSMCWHNPLGSRKHTMEYVGIACATALIKTSFPPDERDCSIHPWTLFQTLSLRYLNASFHEFPTSVGIPKYFSLSASL